MEGSPLSLVFLGGLSVITRNGVRHRVKIGSNRVQEAKYIK